MAQHNELGKKGEQLAVDFLLENEYDIISRNYRFEKAEIDIISNRTSTSKSLTVTYSSTAFTKFFICFGFTKS